MHLTSFRAFAAACALFVLAPRLFAQSGPFLPGMDRMDATMTTLMTRYDVPGAQLAVLRNGRLVLARGYGQADREAGLAVQPDTIFRIASLSKFITAIAILALVAEGRLDLDAQRVCAAAESHAAARRHRRCPPAEHHGAPASRAHRSAVRVKVRVRVKVERYFHSHLHFHPHS